MPVPNPLYNPDWKEIHDYHAAERDRAQQAMRQIGDKDHFDEEAHSEFQEQFTRHHEACLNSFRAQHPTIQAHAEWVFANFNIAKMHAAELPMPELDFETFKTLDDVDTAWSKLNKDVEYALAQKRNAMPVGQPLGIDAFSGRDGSSPLSYTRRFEPEEFQAGNVFGQSPIDTIVTVDRIDDVNHVCLMPDKNSYGLGNNFELVASAIYREAVRLAKPKEDPQATGLLSAISKSLKNAFSSSATEPTIGPDQFRFYLHRPGSEGSFGKEAFVEVKMDFSQGHYHSPQWNNLTVIPEAVQRARFNVMDTYKPVVQKQIGFG